MRKFGFKLFSTNLRTAPHSIAECAEFSRTVDNAFIELMALADTTDDEWLTIKNQIGDIEVRIHASYIGFDATQRELEAQNKKVFAFAQKAADLFNSATIVVHAGYGNGAAALAEAARQFKRFNDSRIVVENLPFIDTGNIKMLCNTAADIKYMTDQSGCGFCFDFSHAICAALKLKIDIETQLKDLYALKPRVYHLCDGNMARSYDAHQHFGKGNYPLAHFMNDLTDENAYITIETGHGIEQHATKKIQDYHYLQQL